VLAGDDVGTYFSNDIARKPSLDEGNPLEAVGQSARRAARALQALEAGDRTKILKAIAAKLRAAAPAILAANAADVADSGDVARELRQRLGLSAAKLETVAKGVEALANAKDPVFLPRPLFASSAAAVMASRECVGSRRWRMGGSRRHRRDASPRETHRSMKHRSASC
jgi:acyl-CoA reductase-like NAD-dependent aldehyde dehydrogenase